MPFFDVFVRFWATSSLSEEVAVFTGMALCAGGVNGPAPAISGTPLHGASASEGPVTVPPSAGGTSASVYRAQAVNAFARNTAGSAPSRIPVARVPGRIGTERWRWYKDKNDRQNAYSRMHIAVNRKLAQMACVSNCHSIVLYFPESMQMQTWSSFGSFDAGVEIYDAVEEYIEREKEVVNVDFVTMWQRHIERDGFPLLDSLIESFRSIGVGEDVLRRLSASFRSNALRHLRGEHSMRTVLARDIEHAISNFCADLDAGRDTAAATAGTGTAEDAPPAAEEGDDEVMDLVDGSTTAAPAPPRATPAGAAPPRATPTGAAQPRATPAGAIHSMLQQQHAQRASRDAFAAHLRAAFASQQAPNAAPNAERAPMAD